MIIVKVPASSANLGPGFDVFAMALTKYVTVTFKSALKLSITGTEPQYANEHNLCYQAFKLTIEHCNGNLEPYAIDIQSEIPIGFGLGSSAALIMAGVLGANYLLGSPLDQLACLNLAMKIESHPDNLAAALYGGCVIITKKDELLIPISIKVAKNIEWYIIIPPKALSTKKAREVLPKTLTYKQTIYNIGQACLTMKALETGDPRLISHAFSDQIHQPYRESLIPEFSQLKTCLQPFDNVACCISGAGSTLLVANPLKAQSPKLLKALQKQFSHCQIETILIEAQGARIWSETTL